MDITNRPGRLFAILIFSPTLIYIGYNIKKNYKIYSYILFFLGRLLFLYELYWILYKPTWNC